MSALGNEGDELNFAAKPLCLTAGAGPQRGLPGCTPISPTLRQDHRVAYGQGGDLQLQHRSVPTTSAFQDAG